MLGGPRRRTASVADLLGVRRTVIPVPVLRGVFLPARPPRRYDMIGIERGRASPRKRRETMTYVVTEACIRCKYMDCVEVCPVDFFYEGENMLVIHPDECIDCGVCEPECPVEAIIPDSEPVAE